MALTVCERWTEKYSSLRPEVVTLPTGPCRFVCWIPEGRIVCTWTMKKARLAYASGFLFPTQGGMKKLSARDAIALLDQAISSKSAQR